MGFRFLVARILGDRFGFRAWGLLVGMLIRRKNICLQALARLLAKVFCDSPSKSCGLSVL